MSLMHLSQLQKGETEGYHKEMEELRRKNANLAKEVERLTMQAEKPLEHQPVTVSLDAAMFYGDPQSGQHLNASSRHVAECRSQYIPKAILGTSSRKSSTPMVSVNLPSMTSY